MTKWHLLAAAGAATIALILAGLAWYGKAIAGLFGKTMGR